jgi:hypothetical protein
MLRKSEFTMCQNSPCIQYIIHHQLISHVNLTTGTDNKMALMEPFFYSDEKISSLFDEFVCKLGHFKTRVKRGP